MPTDPLDVAELKAVEARDNTRLVHVRINAGGQRIIGWVDLSPAASARCSGLLNDADRYLTVYMDPPSEAGTAKATAINKEAISYVEVVGEPITKTWAIPGTFRPVMIELLRPAVVLRGELFVLVDADVGDVLNDDRRFMSVRNAQFMESPEAYAYLAIGKAQTRAVHF